MKSIFMATKNINPKKYGAHIQAVLKVFQEIEKFDINDKNVSESTKNFFEEICLPYLKIFFQECILSYLKTYISLKFVNKSLMYIRKGAISIKK